MLPNRLSQFQNLDRFGTRFLVSNPQKPSWNPPRYEPQPGEGLLARLRDAKGFFGFVQEFQKITLHLVFHPHCLDVRGELSSSPCTPHHRSCFDQEFHAVRVLGVRRSFDGQVCLLEIDSRGVRRVVALTQLRKPEPKRAAAAAPWCLTPSGLHAAFARSPASRYAAASLTYR